MLLSSILISQQVQVTICIEQVELQETERLEKFYPYTDFSTLNHRLALNRFLFD